ncbi:prepilin-type N-terminal cleavage/methylation domain-containing protein [bacterium]|nr:MAG: prepilin-type N-terminal cleavage/methylation domain-containing protein [bacterium]RIK63191.1 MAG: hypothetical protein DCC64_07825 [Planctomycetota bacterium]
MNRLHAHQRRLARGFTLLELVLTMVITGTLLASLTVIVISTVDVKVRLESETRARKLGPAILEIISRDLRNAWATGPDKSENKGEEVKIEGQFFKGAHNGDNDSGADEVWFVTTVDSYMRYEGLRADLCEVGYYVRKNPEGGLSSLYRREDFSIDKRPDEGGLGVRLSDRVVSFRIRYYDRPKNDEDPKAYEEVVRKDGKFQEDDWDIEKHQRLPYAVRIELVLDVTPADSYKRGRERRIGVYETLVRMPDIPKLDDKYQLYQLALPTEPKPEDAKKPAEKK